MFVFRSITPAAPAGAWSVRRGAGSIAPAARARQILRLPDLGVFGDAAEVRAVPAGRPDGGCLLLVVVVVGRGAAEVRGGRAAPAADGFDLFFVELRRVGGCLAMNDILL